MRKIISRLIILTVMAAMVGGCGASGQKYVNVAGQSLPLNEVASAADIDKKMAEDGAVSMKAFAADRKSVV